MNYGYVNVKNLNTVSPPLSKMCQLSGWYKLNINDNGAYELENYGITTVLSKDMRKSFILYGGELVEFGKVVEVRKHYKTEKINKVLQYKTIQSKICELNKTKKKLFERDES